MLVRFLNWSRLFLFTFYTASQPLGNLGLDIDAVSTVANEAL